MTEQKPGGTSDSTPNPRCSSVPASSIRGKGSNAPSTRSRARRVRASSSIVGSVRDARRTHVAYAAELRTLAEKTDGVTLIESFQSDEDFDAWVSAADHLVLPYTRAWSSGALARAQALGTPAIVSAVGGLPEQAGPDDEVVHSDEELTDVFGRIRRNASAHRGEVQVRP